MHSSSPTHSDAPSSSPLRTHRCRKDVLSPYRHRIHKPWWPVRPGNHGRGSRQSEYRRRQSGPVSEYPWS